MDKANKNINKEKSFSITRYALQSFKHYGGKSIILMIALAVTLVLSLFNIMTSLQRTMELAAISSAGDAHFQFLDVTPEQIEQIKKLKEVEWAGEYTYLSRFSANIPDSNKSTEMMCVETLGIMDGFKIVKGRAPQKINEVALPTYVAEYLGIEAKVGAEFEVEIYNQTDVIPIKFKFIVSGIIQEQEFLKIWGFYGIYISGEFVETYANFEVSDNMPYDNRNALVKLKKGYDIYKTVPQIAEIIGIEPQKIGYNYRYLYASLSGFENQIIFGTIIVFFMLVGALIIYNAFNIVIAKRTRHFGLLTLIGASKKQIKKCVYTEAMLNTAVALPIGLLLGTFLSWAVMPLLTASGIISVTMPVVYHVSVFSYIFTILIALLMVAVGAVLPASRAGKISPVEAAKFSPGNIKSGKKAKKIKPVKNISLLSLSRINLFRRKGAGGTVVSLSVVGVLFISIAVILFSTFNSLGGLIKQNMASDIRVMRGIKEGGGIIYSGKKSMFPKNIIEQIINLDGVTKFHVFYYQTYKMPGVDMVGYANGVRIESTGYILGVDDEIMSEYLKYVKMYIGDKVDLKSFENAANVLNLEYISEDLGVSNGFSPGNDLTLDIYANDFAEELISQANLHISAVASKWDIPPYISSAGNLPTLVMPLSSFKANGFDLQCHTICLDIDDSKYDSIAASLEQICAEEGNIHYQSFVEMRKELENQLMSIIILIFAGLGIVFAVGLLNLISSTFIGIEQRKKEIGVLSAIGLGQKELKKMLKWEGIWVSIFSSVASITGGCFLGWLFYLWIESMGGDYIKLSLPVLPVIIFCLIYIFVPYIISNIAVRRLLKNTMVELIGQEI